jgi:hypothetical protein
MLYIFELCQQKQGSYLVFICDFLVLYLITRDLEFIFLVPIRNIIIDKEQSRFKKAYL